MNIQELAALTGTPERQIRYLIAEGFVPAPQGGRARASYGEEHVAAIERYSKLRDLGFPPAAIRRLLETEYGVPFPVAPGVTVLIAPDLIGQGIEPKVIVEQLRKLLEQARKDDPDERNAAPAES